MTSYGNLTDWRWKDADELAVAAILAIASARPRYLSSAFTG